MLRNYQFLHHNLILFSPELESEFVKKQGSIVLIPPLTILFTEYGFMFIPES